MSAPSLPNQATFTLPEVAEITGFTLRSLQEACAGDPPRIAHRHFGRQRVLTREQLAAFIAATEVEAAPKKRQPSTEVIELDRTVKRVANRIAKKRARAA